MASGAVVVVGVEAALARLLLTTLLTFLVTLLVLAAALIVTIGVLLAPATAELLTGHHPLAVATALVGSVGRALDGFTLGAGYIGRLVALLADDDVELDNLAVANAPYRLLGVVLYNGGLKVNQANELISVPKKSVVQLHFI